MLKKLIATVLLLASQSASGTCMDLKGADGLIDFDSVVAFPKPRSITVFRSAEPGGHTYFFVPNSVRLSSDAKGVPEFSLFHAGWDSKQEGAISFTLEPFVDADDFKDIVAEISASDNQATFAVPAPIESVFYIVGPDMPRREVTVNDTSGNPLLKKSGFATTASPIAVRASLLPTSYKYAIFAVGHNFSLRGIARDDAGEPKIIKRRLATSFVVNGVCALFPQLVVNTATGAIGCKPIRYARPQIRQLQNLLVKAGYEVGKIDGVFGGMTEAALRKFQRSSNLPVDGIPSEEMIEALEN
ncbi:peptidoglycan-binding protein [Rhizobium leguminosarum]|uniref:peptidoglycan-binding domain-containing protein n=1 Tax=Rhizobium leguminosarum TaxID=384 RepID=UPI001030CB67|nr:peptidoglycan-binding domain-containing protein [Rhizobium leguminosarum]TBH22189.1 peptidoglycan-binding protein [Rhizobium leguminosarum]